MNWSVTWNGNQPAVITTAEQDVHLIPDYGYGAVFRKRNGMEYDPKKLPQEHVNYGFKIFNSAFSFS